MATQTTVGCGDVCPIAVGSKVFNFFMLMIGLGNIAVPIGLISSALAKVEKDDQSLICSQLSRF